MADVEANDEAYNGGGGFQAFENVATDAILAISFNTAGTRFATTSADHKLRVYNLGEGDDSVLVEQWRAHDAEISEVQWIDSRFGQFLATIGGDNKFKVWREDPFQAHNSGRRFRCIFSQSPFNSVPYVCFDFLTRGSTDIWLALLTYDGLLSLLEPAEPDTLASWKEIDQFYPFGLHQQHQQHSRSSGSRSESGVSGGIAGFEPPLSLTFHRSLGASSQALAAGLDANAISLAVSVGAIIKIFRAIKPGGTETNYQFQETLDIDLAPSLPSTTISPRILNIAWAPGPLRPYDTIAAACEDSTVRVFDIHVPADQHQQPPLQQQHQQQQQQQQQTAFNSPSLSATTTSAFSSNQISDTKSKPSHMRTSSNPASGIITPTPSGIGAGLAGMTRNAMTTTRTEGVISLKYEWEEAAVLSHGHGVPVRKVAWFYDGSTLISTGDDGKLRLWRQGLEGKYYEFSETGPS